MASSSVSQDDIDTDFEKNSRRSRIRTARAARQINSSSSCRAELLSMGGLGDLEHEEAPSSSFNSVVSVSSSVGASDPVNAAGNAGSSLMEEEPSRRIRGGVKKGKQQHRERRKLREKRRSTGVVHLASTESTGGSTTPDEMESSDNETKRNTLLNESDNILLITNRQAQASSQQPTAQHMPSDLEADDENDAEHGDQPCHHPTHSSSFLPHTSPTPTLEEPIVEKVVEENRRLLSMMDEKDKRIHHLEFKIEQLMKDALTISEEQSRLQKENKTLLRALNNLSTKDKP